MGKGDKKSKRGKIIIGSYGVSRKKKKDRKYVPAVTASKAKKGEEKIEITEEKVPVKKTTATKKTVTEKPALKEKAVKAPEKAEVIADETKEALKEEKKTTKKPAATKKAVAKKTSKKTADKKEEKTES